MSDRAEEMECSRLRKGFTAPGAGRAGGISASGRHPSEGKAIPVSAERFPGNAERHRREDTIAIRSRYDPDPAPPRWPRPAPGTHVTPPLARPPRPPQDGGRAAAPEGRGFVLLSPPKLGLGSHCPDPSARRTGLGGAAECRACVGAELGAAGVLLRERPRCLSASAVARSQNSRMAEWQNGFGWKGPRRLSSPIYDRSPPCQPELGTGNHIQSFVKHFPGW